MATIRNLIAGAILGAPLAAGCMEPDCANTYFFDIPQVYIENSLDGRVGDISLELRTDQRPYVPPEHRGISVGTNLSVYCSPRNRYGNTATSGCVDNKKFEFIISIVDSEGNVKLSFPENQAALRSYNQEDIELTGQPDLTARCKVYTPRCSTAGFYYIDEYGRRVFQETAWRPRTLVGIAEAEVVTEELCPAPLPAFKPVDEEEWRQ